MTDANALDVARLDGWLRENVEDFSGTLTAEKFAGGQSNPTYALLLDGEPRYVLRRRPSGDLLPSAHAVDREFRVMSALADTDVPVARCHALCTDESVIGSIFFVMDHVEGRNFWDARLPELSREDRVAAYSDVGRVIAALHSVDPSHVGLGDFGKAGNYYARQIGRWTRQYRATETETIDAMERLIDWLPEHVPASGETRIVHGDYRIDNLIFHPEEPRIVAVVDWELSTLGNPLADFAYHAMAWRLSPEAFRGLAGTDFEGLGIPTEAEHLAAYLARTGRTGVDQGEWEFAIAYNMFRVACIRQGVLKRALSGNASNARALEAGRRARDMAELAWEQVERAFGQ